MMEINMIVMDIIDVRKPLRFVRWKSRRRKGKE